MKALVLWQPWASLMAVGAKRAEIRSLKWKFVGDLAICAAKRPPHHEAYRLCGYARANGFEIESVGLPLGKVLCVVRVFARYSSGSPCVAEMADHMERAFGDFRVGRFIYFTDRLRCLREPVPVIGRQGLFNLPPDVEAKVRVQI